MTIGQENHFVLRGGERIKIGRVVFTVKELANDKYRYCTNNSAKSWGESGELESGIESHNSADIDDSQLSVTDDGDYF